MPQLVADQLLHDPDFLQAKTRILEVVKKHQSKITEIRPPQTAFKQSYENTLQQFNKYRSNPLFYPYLGSGIGNGALVELADGSVKYDLINGIGTHWGHSHPTLIDKGIHAAVEDIAMQGNLQQNRHSFELTKLLIQHSGFDHCILSTSGAIANENALKILFQKQAPAHRILAFENCFIGRTLALSQITDRPNFREGLPQNLQVDYVPFYDWRHPEESTKQAIQTIHTYLLRYPKAHACMCVELIQGEAGSYPGRRDFFVALFELLKKHGIAILVDEVQSFGRTDALFAFQHFGLEDYVDVVTAGKLMHTCVTLFKTAFRPKPGLISQTYTAATSSIYVAHAIVSSLLEEGYLGVNGKNMQLRKLFMDHLQRLEQKHPDKIAGPFGYGLMLAFTPFQGVKQKVIAFARALFDAGIISFISGVEPTRIRFLIPAGGITFQDVDCIASILEHTLQHSEVLV